MRKAAFAGLFACAVIIAMPSPKASASALEPLDFNKLTTGLELAFLGVADVSAETVEAVTTDEPDGQPEPVIHKVEEGETLSEIAKKHKTDWKRLFYKNTDIKHPDVINVNDELTIPDEDEKLKKRPIPKTEQPETPAPVATSSRATRPVRSQASPSRSTTSWKQPTRTYASMNRGSSAGNRYTYGYCTWYVKNRRPDLPNNLGNAITWVARARAQGLPTGRTPRVGAVGQQGNHVVYVEQVHRNGTVTISEMNYKGWNMTNRRTVPASSFTYIY